MWNYLEEAFTDHFGIMQTFISFNTTNLPYETLPTKNFTLEPKMLFALRTFSTCFTTTAFSWDNYQLDPPTFWRSNLALGNLEMFFWLYKCEHGDRLFSRRFPWVTCGWPRRWIYRRG